MTTTTSTASWSAVAKLLEGLGGQRALKEAL
jgi:hypothetical protein